MRRQTLGDGLLAGQLARAIHTAGGGAIGFAIRHVRIAGEHVVGRQVQQRDARLGRRRRQIGTAVPVDRVGLLGVALGVVDMGIGSGIDDQPRPLQPYLARNLVGTGDIQLLTRTAQSHQTEAAGAIDHFMANLTASTAYKDSHCFFASWGRPQRAGHPYRIQRASPSPTAKLVFAP